MNILSFPSWLFLSTCCILGFNMQGQERDAESEKPLFNYDNQYSISIGLGLKGLTGGFAYEWNPHWSARAEIGGIILQDVGMSIELSGQELEVAGGFEIMAASVLFDYYPWENRNFRVFAGMGWAWNQELRGRALYANAVSYGELEFEGEEIGYIDVGIQTRRFLPQLGLAWGRAIPDKRFGVSLAIGSYWWGKPQVDLEATKMLANTVKERDQIENNLSGYQWWPFLQLGLNFRL